MGSVQPGPDQPVTIIGGTATGGGFGGQPGTPPGDGLGSGGTTVGGATTGGGATAGGGGSTGGGATSSGGGSTGGGGTSGGGGTGDSLAGCVAAGGGELYDSIDPINYSGATVDINATHVQGQGCFASMEIVFRKQGACPLTLYWTFAGGFWHIQSASLQSDSQCGSGWGSGKIYSGGSTNATLSAAPSSPTSPGGATSCTAIAGSLKMAGFLNLSNEGTHLQLGLSGLSVTGQIPSTGTGGQCDDPPAPCAGLQCGTDMFGNPCGTCSGELVCQGGQCLDAPSCPPLGTGKGIGSQIADRSFTASDGEQFNLHSLCGTAKAIFIVKTAEW